MSGDSINWEFMVKKRLSLLARSIENEGMQREYFLKAFGLDFGFRNKKVNDWKEYLDSNELAEFRRILESRLDNEPGFLLTIAERSYQICMRVEEVADRITSHEAWQVQSRNGLALLFDGFIQAMLELTPVIYIIPVDEIIERRLRAYLYERLLTMEKADSVDNYFLIVTKPERDIAAIREHRALLRICAEIQADKSLLAALKSADMQSLPIDLRQKLRACVDQYSWINTDDFEGRPWTLEDYLARIRFLVRKDCKEELSRIEKTRKREKLRCEQILQELQPTGEFLEMIKTATEYSYLRTYRAEVWIRALYQARSLLAEIARRMELEPDDMKFLTFEEIQAFLWDSHVVSKDEIQRRKEGFDYVMIDGEVSYSFGRAAAREVPSVEPKPGSITRIEGTIANLGLVRGRVKITHDILELHKVEEGDILVASMTVPEFMPAMERAGGFVTDEGGLTCHAAIVSRELDVPCIIATGNATRVLRDNDFVELNANKGYILKLPASTGE